MSPFFIILFIFVVIIILFLLIYLSSFEIQIKKLDFDSEKKINDYLFYIRIKFLNKITWIKFKIDSNRIDRYKKINNKFFKNVNIDFKSSLKEIIKSGKVDIVLNRIDLKLKIDLVNPVITSLSTAFISTILSIINARYLKRNQKEKYMYKITPLYSEKIELKISLNCIVSIKMVHIIYIFYNLLKNKKGSVLNGEKSSNRRPYARNNE